MADAISWCTLVLFLLVITEVNFRWLLMQFKDKAACNKYKYNLKWYLPYVQFIRLSVRRLHCLYARILRGMWLQPQPDLSQPASWSDNCFRIIHTYIPIFKENKECNSCITYQLDGDLHFICILRSTVWLLSYIHAVNCTKIVVTVFFIA